MKNGRKVREPEPEGIPGRIPAIFHGGIPREISASMHPSRNPQNVRINPGVNLNWNTGRVSGLLRNIMNGGFFTEIFGIICGEIQEEKVIPVRIPGVSLEDFFGGKRKQFVMRFEETLDLYGDPGRNTWGNFGMESREEF